MSRAGKLRSQQKRKGLSSMLAMLYLVLFSVMGIGFYEACTMSAQIARNERAQALAQSAADGGMQFVRYQLGSITIDPSVTDAVLLDTVATQLAKRLNGTDNMNGHTVQNTGGVIYIPSASDWTTIDSTNGTRFRGQITQSGSFLVVTATGAGPGVISTRNIRLQFQKAPKAATILNYGVATKGPLATGGASYIKGLTDPTKGSILSADMTNPTPISIGGKAVSGDISIVNPAGTVATGGASIGGTSDPSQVPQHIHKGVPAPTFPTIDTSVFTAYATNKYAGGTTLNNVYIPPNTNPQFTGGATINGVLWIQAPNVVTFKGNATINGVIVTDNNATFNPAANQINFGGTVTATPIQNLPPGNPAYDPNLVKLTGSFLLAPAFAVSMTGNFGTIGGSMAVGQLSMSGNAAGTVQGSILGMQDVPMNVNGSSDIIIASSGTSNYPTGMNFGDNFTPLPGTYLELTAP